VSVRLAYSQQGERLKDTARRVQDGVKVAFNKAKYEEAIGDLRDSNSDLKGLREQITELEKPRQPNTQLRCKVQASPEFSSHCKVRKVSKALHEALIGAWSCGQASHLRHLVKLFLETGKTDDHTQMNLAIICPTNARSRHQASLLHLQVLSQNLDWLDIPRLPSPAPSQEASEGRPRKRAKGVRFLEAIEPRTSLRQSSGSAQPGRTPSPDFGSCSASCDLRCSKDICSDLAKKSVASSPDPGCLGHIDTRSDESFRHSFYPLKNSFCPDASQGIINEGDIATMDQILDLSAEEYFDMVDRLRLARLLVSAVLKFHSTPWMAELWRLKDLSFFQNGEDIKAALRTLHLGVEFAQQKLTECNMDGVLLTPASSTISQVNEDERLSCGINNMTLHSLGVALLQIDRWTRIEPEDVLKVRKLAVRGSTLGPRYQELTHKCLSCDFGYGSDLKRPQLQKAVYDNVVGVLEGMISSLDLGGSD
jgi:hypothetical protein